MSTVVLATGNAGKLREMERLTAGIGIVVQAQSDFGVGAVEETGLTFVENALIKARHACEETGLPAIADDSGLAVDALDGRPGIYSARYAGENASDEQNVDKLLCELAQTPEQARGAQFHCVVVLLRHPKDPCPLIAHGQWAGRITDAPRGEDGFGYDPVFYVPDRQRTAAELAPEEKDAISHRGIALRHLTQELTSRVQL
ncbi:MAG: XTP/dITP diphosphatase [Gammaproteobacteria bacterium]|nr:XTP/dITP diphosphatase [Gammaproteobacteria bacterium]